MINLAEKERKRKKKLPLACRNENCSEICESKQVSTSWCFRPSQPLRLYPGEFVKVSNNNNRKMLIMECTKIRSSVFRRKALSKVYDARLLLICV